MSNTSKIGTTVVQSGRSDVGSIRVGQRQFAALHVGYFEHGIPEPVLFFSVTPDVADEIGASLARKYDRGGHELICNFQNFGTTPCDVTVSTRGGGHGSHPLA